MRIARLRHARRRLSINGAVKQRSDLSHHIWTVPETVRAAPCAMPCCAHAARPAAPWCCAHQISYLSRLVALAPGDLLFMGTPEGVGPVVRGDVLEAAIDGCVAVAVARSEHVMVRGEELTRAAAQRRFPQAAVRRQVMRRRLWP